MWPTWPVYAARVIIKIPLIIDKTTVLSGTRVLLISSCGPRRHFCLLVRLASSFFHQNEARVHIWVWDPWSKNCFTEGKKKSNWPKTSMYQTCGYNKKGGSRCMPSFYLRIYVLRLEPVLWLTTILGLFIWQSDKLEYYNILTVFFSPNNLPDIKSKTCTYGFDRRS